MTMMTEDRERVGLRMATGERGARARVAFIISSSVSSHPFLRETARHAMNRGPRVMRESSIHASLRARRANG